ncbi:MAG: hypothetical protein ACE5R4_07975 [Armatimonadota bacterium]
MSKGQFAITLMVVAVAGLVGGALSDWARGRPVAAQPEPARPAGGPDAILGIVEDGDFHPVWPRLDLTGRVRLTATRMQEAIAPEAGELALADYEDRAIMVTGRDGGGWVYSAAVVDQAGPIVTTTVRRVFAGEE